MDNAEFILLVKTSRRTNGTAAADSLLAVVRRKVLLYLIARGQKPDNELVEDLTNTVMVRLYEKSVPDKYAWKMWLHFIVKRAWAEYCRDNFVERNLSLNEVTLDMLETKERAISVPVRVNARMLEEDGGEILKRRVAAFAPRDAVHRKVWEWAVSMLVDMGAVMSEQMAAARSGLDAEVARQVILEAVLTVRQTFEEMFGDEGIHAVEECCAARDLAAKIF